MLTDSCFLLCPCVGIGCRSRTEERSCRRDVAAAPADLILTYEPEQLTALQVSSDTVTAWTAQPIAVHLYYAPIFQY